MSLELALYSAATNGYNEELIKLIDEHDININVQDGEGNTPLMVAAMKGHIECVMTILRKEPNVNMRNSHRETALMLAIYADSVHRMNIVKMLIVCGASINAVNNRHENAMMLACQRGLLDIVKLFHYYNSSPFIVDVNGNTLLHHACINGNEELVDFLIDIDTPINKINKFHETPLSLAVEHSNKQIITKLLKNYANDQEYNKNGDTLLHLAISMADTKERIEIAQLFVKNTTNIDVQNDKGKTCLMIACENNLNDLVKQILQRYPNTSLVDNKKNTCLSYALINKNDDMVFDILSYDTSIIAIPNEDGENAFMQACRSTKYAVEILKESYTIPLDLNKQNLEGNTALHIAVKHELYEIVKYLLTFDVNPRILNNRGEDVLTIALSKGWRTEKFNIVRELRRFFLKERISKSIDVDTDICAICMEETNEVQLCCNHVYHIICVLELIDYQEVDSRCPLCRQNILV